MDGPIPRCIPRSLLRVDRLLFVWMVHSICPILSEIQEPAALVVRSRDHRASIGTEAHAADIIGVTLQGGDALAGGEPGGRVVGFVTSPPARRISGRGVVRWNGRSTLVPVLCVPKFCRVFQTAVLTVESKPPNGQNGDQDAG